MITSSTVSERSNQLQSRLVVCLNLQPETVLLQPETVLLLPETVLELSMAMISLVADLLCINSPLYVINDCEIDIGCSKEKWSIMNLVDRLHVSSSCLIRPNFDVNEGQNIFELEMEIKTGQKKEFG